MHLHMAEQIRQRLGQLGHGRLQQQVVAQWPAFYLGSVAPDVNAISQIARSETHFYQAPPLPAADAYLQLLVQHPQLRKAAQLPPAQAMFVAAYGAHLLLDLVWLREVDYPLFFQSTSAVSAAERRLVHFVLLTYLDQLALGSLPATAVDHLNGARPSAWLPFVPDSVLVDWRHLLASQLQPGGTVQTTAIFGRRVGLSADEFASYLADASWMEAHIFSPLPLAHIQQCLQTAVDRSVDFVASYLQTQLDVQ